MDKIIELKDRKQITKDWISCFPNFRVYKPMWLIRRNSMFVCGIHLQMFSSCTNYEPLFHIHNLAVDFPSISLGTSTNLLNHKLAKDAVRFIEHHEQFANYAERLKQQVSLLQKDSFTCDDLVSYIKTTVSNPDQHHYYPSSSFMDIILALFWHGRVSEAEQELENAKKIMSQWDDNVWVIKHLGIEGWEQLLRQLMNLDKLRANVEMQMRKHKLEKFGDFQFMN